jgi:hypothetical protein
LLAAALSYSTSLVSIPVQADRAAQGVPAGTSEILIAILRQAKFSFSMIRCRHG